MSRILCFVQRGASYQCSAERMSSRPSRLKSATATLSLKPGSIIWTRNAMSAGRGLTASAGTWPDSCAMSIQRRNMLVSRAKVLLHCPHDIGGDVAHAPIGHFVPPIGRHDRDAFGGPFCNFRFRNGDWLGIASRLDDDALSSLADDEAAHRAAILR